MKKVYVFGHRNPDTDSVTSAIALSYLKNKMGMNTEPRVLGEISKETKYVLDYFNIKIPRYLNDVKLQMKDLNYHKNLFVHENTSLEETYSYMINNNTTGLPIVKTNNEFVGLVTIKNIAKALISGDVTSLNTSYENILKTLQAEEILKFDEEIKGNILVASYRSTTFMNNVHLKNDDILIVGDRHSIIEHAVESGVKLIIVVGNGEIKEKHIDIAKENKVNIVRTSLNTFQTSRLIALANYVSILITEERPYTFEQNDYYDDFLVKSSKLKFNNYPIIDKGNICSGLIRVTEITEKDKKKVILVDHNEESQSVIGLDEAEILEIVDHHKLGTIATNNPINFRNMSVGSTNTIVYHLYQESGIDIPKDISGIMLAGILSDTLSLTSPTTTEIDKKVVKILSEKLEIDYKEFALDMFKAGTSLEGKTKEEIINGDIKSFDVEDLSFAVSQVFTLNFDEILKEKEEYLSLIEKMAKDREYRLVVLAITDIIKNGSYIFYTEDAKELLEEAYDIENLEQGYYIDGFVSRKKQIVPSIMEVLH